MTLPTRAECKCPCHRPGAARVLHVTPCCTPYDSLQVGVGDSPGVTVFTPSEHEPFAALSPSGEQGDGE